ncbi:SCO6745 family protein [Nocardia sp. CA-119907]|uniref:SCO6745 family protein n=1 Tax=Nocardia sp. CA-119907 TaxID=3239973 RepID=UPI003D97B7E9
MVIHLARRIWTTLEPLHDVVYFGAGVKEAGLALGLRGFWQTYFAFRAAPLGAVGAGAVSATFAGFHPDMVGKAVPDAWARTTPDECLAARLDFSTGLLRGAGAGDAECARAVDLLEPVSRAADATGRALYAANAELPLAADPVAALWQLATTLREHRGDGHVAALISYGLTGSQALVLQVAAGKAPESVMRPARGWSEPEWSDIADELRTRGLIEGEPTSPALTGAGAELLDRVEAITDEAAWNGALSALSQDAIAELTDTLAPLVRRVQESLVPPINPIGMAQS